MLRVFAVLVAAAVPAAAQRDLLAVRLHDGARPVEGALGALTCRPLYELSALGTLPAIPRMVAAPARREIHATSDKRGMLRFASGDGFGLLAGSGLVTTKDGLGALIVDLQPGRADTLQMETMAAVGSATDGENITVFARALLPAGRSVVLPPIHDGRLPAGTYDAWVLGERGWVWQRLSLVAGQRAQVAFDGDAQRLRSPGNYVHPEGRPEIDLLGGRDETIVRGSGGRGARGASFVAWTDGGVFGPQALPVASDAPHEPVQWPVRDAGAQQTLGPVPTGVPRGKLHLFGVVRSSSGDWQVRACSAPADTPAGPAFVLPPPPAGDAWLLFVADGHAPQAAPWTRALAKFPFELDRGYPLRVVARDANDESVVDLAVEYVPTDMIAASVAGHTDHRGDAQLGQAKGPGMLRVSDARFANVEIPLDGIPIDGVQVKVAAGETLRGTATWLGGKPAARVVVELRDPRGVLRPAVRTAVTGEDGTFTFTGLPPPEIDLVLFAGAAREHRTWSAKLDRVHGGATETLVLKNEDPQLEPSQPGPQPEAPPGAQPDKPR